MMNFKRVTAIDPLLLQEGICPSTVQLFSTSVLNLANALMLFHEEKTLEMRLYIGVVSLVIFIFCC
jgi:hypothetical protein